MELLALPHDFSICKVADVSQVDWSAEFTFVGATDQERSLVCVTEAVPADTLERDDGWKAFRVQGVLDFSLIGVLAGISRVLAEADIGLFVVSTFNTDYVLTRREKFPAALEALRRAGYTVTE